MKNETKEEFKNEFVHFVVNKKPHCIVEYEVEIQPSVVIEAHKKAAKIVGKEVNVPGFRKGKAAPDIVAKRYPHELDRRWQELIADSAYRECAKLAHIPLIRSDATISFKMQEHSRNGAKLVLSFETIPSIPPIDPANCILQEIVRPEVNEDKVKETIRQAQLFFAKWEYITDRPVQEEDFLILDVEVIEEDPPEKLFTNTRFEVKDRSMAQWMKKLVLGQNTGAVLEGISIPDDNLTEEQKSEYAPKKVGVTIKAIENADLPPLDDAFAQKLGVKSMEELHKRIEEILTKKADEHVRELYREQVTDFLLGHPFEIPSSVVEKETQFRIRQMIQDPAFKKKWDQSNDQEKRELIDSVQNQAEKAVRIFYLCRKISSDQNISITPKDIPLVATSPLEALLYPTAQPHDPRQPDVKQAEAYSRVLLEKTEDWVIAHARFTSIEEKKERIKPKEEKEKKVDKIDIETLEIKKEAKPAKPKAKAAKKPGTPKKEKKAKKLS